MQKPTLLLLLLTLLFVWKWKLGNFLTNFFFFAFHRTRRRGFQHYVVGQLRECAKNFYNENIHVRVQEDLSTNECECYGRKKLYFITKAHTSCFRYSDNVSGRLQQWRHKGYHFSADETVDTAEHQKLDIPHGRSPMDDFCFRMWWSLSLLFKVFPFCIVIDPEMRISQLGPRLESLFDPDNCVIGKHISDVFTLLRPDILHIEWEKVCASLFFASSHLLLNLPFSISSF